MPMDLIKVQQLIDICALSLQSTYVNNEANGVSILLISSPETAKTSTIFKFHNLDFVSYYDEVTAKKLIEEFLPAVKSGIFRTLLVPDIINCVEKQKSTRDQFLALIKSGIDDTGIIKIATHYKNLDMSKQVDGVKFNMITAATIENFTHIKKYVRDTGLLSRFIPFSYGYPLSLIHEIFNKLEGEISNDLVSVPKIFKVNKKVEGNPNLFKNFEIMSTSLGLEYGAYGIRAQTNFQRLAKANALLNKRDIVTEEDIDKVIYLSNWVNLKFNMIV